METTEFNIEALPVKIEYVAEVPSPWDSDKKTNVDQWRVVIETKAGYWSTDYYTGLGLRRKPSTSWDKARPKKPTIADVLYSLFMDASAADLNFHDWCSEFGASDDSIRALNTYKKCLEIGTALRKHFSPEQRKFIELVISEM